MQRTLGITILMTLSACGGGLEPSPVVLSRPAALPMRLELREPEPPGPAGPAATPWSRPPLWDQAFAEGLGRPLQITIGQDLRQGHCLARGRPLTASFDAPGPGARLTFSYALLAYAQGRPGEPRLRVTLTGPDATAAPVELGFEALDRWIQDELELAPGRSTLTLELLHDEAGEAYAAVETPVAFTPRERPPTVCLITSDTHRADHVGAAGSVAIETPTFDALAARGLYFSDCFASSNITVPSHASLMTGLSPRDTGVTNNRTILVNDAPTLAAAFRDAGYATCAVTSVNLLSTGYSGLGIGFDRVQAPAAARSADETVALALGDLAEHGGRPLFLWVHVFDAHSPYQPPGEWRERFYRAGGDPFDPSLDPEAGGARIPRWAEGVRDVEYIRALYSGEIGFLDEQLGLVVEHERVRDGVIAFTADHGEVLGAHETWWAHKGLYTDTLSVPLAIAWPGPALARRIDEPVSQLDLGRTLLDLAGLREVGFPGRNLIDAAAGGGLDQVPRYALGEQDQTASVNVEGWHLVLNLKASSRGDGRGARERHQVELFDLRADPGCLDDRIAAEPGRARLLRAGLLRWLRDRSRPTLSGRQRDDPETLRMLATLGYASGGDPEPAGTGEERFPESCDCVWCVRFDG